MGNDGPFTVPMAARACEGNTERARALVRRLVTNGILVQAGELQLQEVAGRRSPMSKVYTAATLKVKKDWLLHDTMLHYWKILLPDARIVLGYDCEPAFRADGEATFSDETEGVIEMDMETESLTEVLKRLAVHKGHDRDVFFITLTAARVKKVRIRLHDEDLCERVWFGVWYDLIQRPNVWMDVNGETREVYPAKG